jgi:hypothetical protein
MSNLRQWRQSAVSNEFLRVNRTAMGGFTRSSILIFTHKLWPGIYVSPDALSGIKWLESTGVVQDAVRLL